MRSLLLVAALGTTAYAGDPPEEDQAFVAALAKGDAKALGEALATPLHVAKVPFTSATCKKSFGHELTITDPVKLAAFAKCLTEIKLDKDAAQVRLGERIAGTSCTADSIAGGHELVLTFALTEKRPWKIQGVEITVLDGELGGVAGSRPRLCANWVVPKKIKVKDLVQPVKVDKQQPMEDPDGVEGGVIDGVDGVPPPPPPPPPPNVAPTVLESLRIKGNRVIVPDDATKTDIARSPQAKLIGSFKMCLATTGEVATVTMLKSTGFAAYDTKIKSEMRGWAYRPYKVNGTPIMVCTAVTFIYSQH